MSLKYRLDILKKVEFLKDYVILMSLFRYNQRLDITQLRYEYILWCRWVYSVVGINVCMRFYLTQFLVEHFYFLEHLTYSKRKTLSKVNWSLRCKLVHCHMSPHWYIIHLHRHETVTSSSTESFCFLSRTYHLCIGMFDLVIGFQHCFCLFSLLT